MADQATADSKNFRQSLSLIHLPINSNDIKICWEILAVQVLYYDVVDGASEVIGAVKGGGAVVEVVLWLPSLFVSTTTSKITDTITTLATTTGTMYLEYHLKHDSCCIIRSYSNTIKASNIKIPS